MQTLAGPGTHRFGVRAGDCGLLTGGNPGVDGHGPRNIAGAVATSTALSPLASAVLSVSRAGLVGFADLAADEFAVERERLKHDVVAFAVLVREHESDIEPEVILAFTPNDRIDAVRRLFRLLSLRHGKLLLSGCDVLREQAPRTHGLAPASADRSSGNGGESIDRVLVGGRSSRQRKLICQQKNLGLRLIY